MSGGKEGFSSRKQLMLIYITAPVIMMGIQLILPALPVMQRELGLSEGEIALVTSIYLLPSVIFAFLSGFLADRFGKRQIYALSLAVFGFAGVGIAITKSFPIILLLRFVQGSAFAAVTPLSITMIGDMLSGTEQIAAQGHRVVAMALGDTLLPVIGGILATVGWFAPFFLPALALPLALLAWFLLPGGDTGTDYSTSARLRELGKSLRVPMALSLELAGFLRMFFKFAFITYLPILLVTRRDMAPGFAGLALGVAAFCGMMIAAFSGKLVEMINPSRLLAVSLILISLAFAGIVVIGHSPLPVLLASLLFGLGDGMYGVLQNSFITQIISDELRATFVATIGSIRNFGKFLAPSLLGLSTLLIPLEISYIILAFLAILATFTVGSLKQLDSQLVGEQETGQTI